MGDRVTHLVVCDAIQSIEELGSGEEGDRPSRALALCSWE